MKYSKNQQDYINSVGGALAHPSALTVIGKQDMTIALLMGALKMSRVVLEQHRIEHTPVGKNLPISTIIDSAISDAEKGGLRVVGTSQLVEALLKAREKLIIYRRNGGDGGYQGGMEYTALMRMIDGVLGLQMKDGEAEPAPNPEYQTIVYY